MDVLHHSVLLQVSPPVQGSAYEEKKGAYVGLFSLWNVVWDQLNPVSLNYYILVFFVFVFFFM